jgi:gliding motility associated protien GldN
MRSLFCLLCCFTLLTGISPAQCTGVNHPDPLGPDPCANDRISRPFPMRQPYLREANVMWSKRIWRVIDLREKMNLALYYPMETQFCLQSLFDVLKCAVLEGDLKAFANPVFDDEFSSPMTRSEISSLLVSWDSTHQSEDVNDPGNYISTPLKKEITSAGIRQYWIKEDWFFDGERSVMEVRIIGICPLSEKVSESGEVIGVKPLFWIYFPDARPYLAKAAVFNFHNDSGRMSFDELFVKRRFASYIYKESNVYNRQIRDYKAGLDALLESEAIAEEIFHYEEDLWHR